MLSRSTSSNRYLTGYLLSSSGCTWVMLQKNVLLTLSPPCEALTLTSGLANFKTAKSVLFSQSCSNIQPRDNRSQETKWVIRICGLVKASFAGVPGEDWNCQKPCLACVAAMFANISVCGPWFFSSVHNLHFLIISFSHLTSRESRKCSGTPHSFVLPPMIHRAFIENHSTVQTTKIFTAAIQCYRCRCSHAAEAWLCN